MAECMDRAGITPLNETDKDTIRVMVSGKTGAGKSSLLNFIFGIDFEVGRKRGEHMTKVVTLKETVKENMTLKVFDTPGFQDYSGNEDDYIEQIKKECVDIDLFIFCISALQNRADLDEDMSALYVVTKGLGKDIWKNAVVAITFSNIVQKRFYSRAEGAVDEAQEKYKALLQQWKQKVHAALAKAGVSDDVILRIPMLPTGHHKELTLADQEDWISATWAQCFSVAKDATQRLIFLAELHKFIRKTDPELEEYRRAKDITPENRRIVLTDPILEIIRETTRNSFILKLLGMILVFEVRLLEKLADFFN